MITQPLISVIIPVYQVEAYLRRCLDSVINQTYRNLEILVIDDGSPDQCGQICDDYAVIDPRITVIHQVNQGVATARNTGLNQASGDLIGFVDSDDWAEPHLYELLEKHLREQHADVAICEFRKVYQDRQTDRPKGPPEIFSGQQAIAYHLNKNKMYQIVNGPWNKLFRREILKEIRFPDGFVYEDIVFNIEALLACRTCVYIRDIAYNYLADRPGSATNEGFNPKEITHKVPMLKRRLELLKGRIPPKLYALAAAKFADTLLFDHQEITKSVAKADPALFLLLNQEIDALLSQGIPLSLPKRRQLRQILKRQPARKKMVMYFDRLEKIHLYKDVGMVPYYLAREFDYDLEYVTAADCEPDNFRGHAIRKLKRYPNEKYNLHFYAYLLRHARTIDVLVTLHCRDYSLMLGRIYKLLNPKGIFYIKGDYNNFTNEKIRKRLAYQPSIKDFSLGRLREKYRTRRAFARLKQVDILSIEQMEVYEDILEHGLGGQDVRAITQFLINGFDDSDQIAVKPYSEKENLMITVGTIGLPRKNNEMLLEALKTIDLGDWRVALVGPIVEPAFQVYLENLKHSHTSLWQRLILTGNIDDRRVLYDYYNRAKVFCLTSKSEAFAMVFPEAAYFANHIVTTKVGGAAEITHKGTVGRLIEQGDIEALRQELQRVIQDPAYCQFKVEQQRQQSHEVCWSHLIRQAALFEAKLRYR